MHNPEVKKYLREYRARQKLLPKNPKTEEQKNRIRDYSRQWAKRNKERIKGYQEKWIQKPGVKERLRQYDKMKRAQDPSYRLACVLRCRVRAALSGRSKSASASALLGCSIQSFKIYLESNFQNGMTWENYGEFWEIDHIIPCALFDLSIAEHQKRCFHFSNQQPLTVSDNRKKHTSNTTQICQSWPCYIG